MTRGSQRDLRGVRPLVGIFSLSLAVGCVFNSHGLGTSASDSALASSNDDASVGSGEDSSGGATTGGSEGASASASGSGSASSEPATTSTTEPTTGLSVADTSDGSSTGEPPCDDPQVFYADGDGDGFGDPELSLSACAPPPGYVDDMSDCDDGKGAVFPGADEVCNGIDDDCDQLVDEYAPSNAGACDSCETVVAGDRVYFFCSDSAKWQGARGRCQKRGADLVIIGSEAEFGVVWGQLKNKAGEFWVGASDRDTEGSYLWIDGSPLAKSDPHWAMNEPQGDQLLVEFDCVALGGGSLAQNPGRYGMVACDPLIDRRWVCEGPL